MQIFLRVRTRKNMAQHKISIIQGAGILRVISARFNLAPTKFSVLFLIKPRLSKWLLTLRLQSLRALDIVSCCVRFHKVWYVVFYFKDMWEVTRFLLLPGKFVDDFDRISGLVLFQYKFLNCSLTKLTNLYLDLGCFTMLTALWVVIWGQFLQLFFSLLLGFIQIFVHLKRCLNLK